MNGLRATARRMTDALGGTVLRVVAVGGPAAVAFLAIWPVSTVLIVLALTAVTALHTRRTARTRAQWAAAGSSPTARARSSDAS